MQNDNISKNLSHIKHMIAVMSGKGGVGKTTVAVNLAVQLGKSHKVALLDADIDCPNVNKMLGITERISGNENRLIPISKYNIKVVSFASFQDDETQPIIWRGPLLTKAILQLMEQVEWGELDYLIIDLPPGTSDLPLTILQILKPEGVIVVTTPQTMALTDAKKSINMAFQLNIPVIGVIENMSGNIFGRGLAKRMAEEYDIDFLGNLDLSVEIAKSAEDQKPFVLTDNSNFKQIVDKIKNE